MPARRPPTKMVRRFLDLDAREAHDEDSDGDSDASDLSMFDEEIDDLDAELRGPAHTRPSFEDLEDEEEDVERIVAELRKRALERGYNERQNNEPSQGSGIKLRLPTVTEQGAVEPTLDDMYLFSVQVKKGKERVAVIRLLNKALTLNIKVGSIFEVPRAPGRIYIEAGATAPIRRLCEGMLYVYFNSIFIVPVSERVALLSSGGGAFYYVGDVVVVRNGVYLGDTGEVVDASESDSFLTVKLMSRERLPIDEAESIIDPSRPSSPDGTSAQVMPTDTLASSVDAGRDVSSCREIPSSDVTCRDVPMEVDSSEGRDQLIGITSNGQHKRKRENGFRRQQYLLNQPILDALLRAGHEHEHEDLGDKGFTFQGNHFSTDGYRLLRIRRDRVERYYGPPVIIDAFVSRPPPHISDRHMREVFNRFQTSNRITSESETLGSALPVSIHEGDIVRVTEGEGSLKNSVGRVLEVKTATSSAIIDLQKWNPELQRTILVDVKFNCLARVFEVGDAVQIIFGVWKGRTGMIAGILGDEVTVVDPSPIPFECVVPMGYLDSYKIPLTMAPPKRKYNVDLSVGAPVRVLSGKHAGKTGIVSILDGNIVRMIEDKTETELFIRADNLEPNDEQIGLSDLTRPEDRFDPDKFKEHTRRLKEAISSEDPTPEEEKEEEKEEEEKEKEKEEDTSWVDYGMKCDIDHAVEGFEGQLVYVWRGRYKGKLGRVHRLSGMLVRLGVESAIRGKSILDVATHSVAAKCTCVLDLKTKLPWDAKQMEDFASLFRREICPRGNTPPKGSLGSSIGDETRANQPVFHDPSGEGMWIFNKGIAQVRKKYDLIVKIVSHNEGRVSGQTNGRVVSCENPLAHPVTFEAPAEVTVRFVDNVGRERVEDMPVFNLRRTPLLKNRGTHVIIDGPRTGTVVKHIKSCGDVARVHPAGAGNRKTIYVEKEKLCIIDEAPIRVIEAPDKPD